MATSLPSNPIYQRAPTTSAMWEENKDRERTMASVWKIWFQAVAKFFNPARALVAPTLGASPFIYHYIGLPSPNPSQFGPVNAVVSAGTVSAVAVSRDGITYYNVSTSSNVSTQLSVGDYIRITYTVAPNFVLIPQ